MPMQANRGSAAKPGLAFGVLSTGSGSITGRSLAVSTATAAAAAMSANNLSDPL